MQVSFRLRPSLSAFGRVAAMALLAACFLSVSPARAFQASPPAPNGSQAPGKAQADPHAAAEAAAESQALGFLEYLDHKRYRDSYAYTSRLLRAKLNQDEFARKVEEARASAGEEKSRELLNASYTTEMQGQPVGQYVVLQYGTDFSKKPDATETLVMSFENGYWRVAGWFIK